MDLPVALRRADRRRGVGERRAQTGTRARSAAPPGSDSAFATALDTAGNRAPPPATCGPATSRRAASARMLAGSASSTARTGRSVRSTRSRQSGSGVPSASSTTAPLAEHGGRTREREQHPRERVRTTRGDRYAARGVEPVEKGPLTRRGETVAPVVRPRRRVRASELGGWRLASGPEQRVVEVGEDHRAHHTVRRAVRRVV